MSRPSGAPRARPAYAPPERERFVSRPAGSYPVGGNFDMREVTKHGLFASPAESCDDHFEKSRPCPSAVYGVSDQYLVLDSFEKVPPDGSSGGSQPSKGVYQFNFDIQGVTAAQKIGVRDKIDTVIEAQVGSFYLPCPGGFDKFDPETLTALNPTLAALDLTANWGEGGPPNDTPCCLGDPRSQLAFGPRITMYLREIGLQSISDSDGRRHHFEFEVFRERCNCGDGNDCQGGRMLLHPLHDFDTYCFTDPIQDVHGLTVSLFNASIPLQLAPDVVEAAVSSSNGVATDRLEFVVRDPTNTINLVVGDRVFVRGFATPFPVLNGYVCRPEGHLVGSDGYDLTPPTAPHSGTTITFRLNPDVSVLSYYPTGTLIAPAVEVRIAKNRVRIPLRFRRVVDRLTNYKSP